MRDRQAYVVGGGIAGLAAATLLIRDGGFRGESICVLERSKRFGGSLDGAGNAQAGYVIRGGRMFEAHFGCTFDLFDSIPSLTSDGLSVSAELHAFNRRVVGASKSRIVSSGRKIEAPAFGLSLREKWDLARLTLIRESTIGGRTIDSYFSPSFFETNFWLMWSTTFAFQSWHSLIEFRRYIRRFIHLLPGFSRLEGIKRTPLNQYDSLVSPLLHWLREAGVELRSDTEVTDIRFSDADPPRSVTAITLEDSTGAQQFNVNEQDLVLITLGSMTEDSALGTMDEAPNTKSESVTGSWGLWRNIATSSEHFGRPRVFCGDTERSSWESFTVTLDDPTFFEFMERLTGNRAGTGGLVTIKDSNWLLSIVLPYQPHFLGQPEHVQVFWGYGLTPGRPGNSVKKRMSECSGKEILQELLFHLPVGEARDRIIATANCIPCLMPFITSQFMPRRAGDRPAVIPANFHNFAFLGQFCEVADDTVFTVEYSVRTAQTAVYGLLDLPRALTPIYRGNRDLGVVLRALRALA